MAKWVFGSFGVFLIHFCVNSSCWALSEQECSSVDLRAKGKSMYQAPNFNQAASLYCWNFAGTQLASAFINKENQARFNLDTNKVILSPTVTLNQLLQEKEFCPTPCSVVDHVVKLQKGCAYTDVKVRMNQEIYTPDTGEKVRDIKCSMTPRASVSEVEDVLRGAMTELYKKPLTTKEFITKLAVEVESRRGIDSTSTSLRALQKYLRSKAERGGVNMASIYNLTVAPGCVDLTTSSSADGGSKFVGSEPLNQVLSSAVKHQPACYSFRSTQLNNELKREFPDCPVLPSDHILEKGEYLRKINARFDSDQALPVAIDYCYTFLFDGEYTDSNRLCQFRSGRPATDHKSLLIGRRFNRDTQKCEFLLRDSEGNSCDHLHKNFKAGCEQELRVNKAADVWISESLLEKVVHGLSVIENHH